MTENFWINRINMYGHTGWSDGVISSYDQCLRLKLIREIIYLFHKNGMQNVLDFGCGSGDFSNLFGEFSSNVVGVDIAEEILSVAKRNAAGGNIIFFTVDDPAYKTYKYDLINSVTVLQHILDDRDMQEVLGMFYDMLDDNGILIIIDSFNLDEKCEYTRFRNFELFCNNLADHNFKILKTCNLYHPQYNPTKLSKLFCGNTLIKLFNRFQFRKMLKTIAEIVSSFDDPIVVEDSPTKLIVAGKC